MIRQTININKFEYVVDLYDVTQNEYTPPVSKEYVILRNISFIENISYDTDIFFIEKDVFNEIKNSDSIITNKIVTPVHNNYFGSFSKSISDFSSIISKNNFKLEIEGGSVFSLLKWNGTEYSSDNVLIKCDKIKIYHPHNKTDLDYIIYIDNTINGIHFHYFCNLNTNCVNKSETQFTSNNILYSEYIEVYLPNIYELFTEHKIIKDENGKILKDDNIYFNDFYNVTKFVNIKESDYNKYKHDLNESTSSWLTLKKEQETIFDDVEKMSYLPLYMLLHPFITIAKTNDGEDYFEKIYFKLSHQDTNNYNSLPLNITLYPFEQNVNETFYLTHPEYFANSDVFTKDFNFSLCSRLGFDENQLSIISSFNFYNKKDEKLNPNGLTIEEAYAKYNGLTLCEDQNGKYFEEYVGWIKTYEQWVLDQPSGADTSFERYRYLHNDEYLLDSFISCCGYKIEIATDFSFKNIIADNYVESKENSKSHSIIFDNFSFSLLHLFENWEQLPKTLTARVKFIDKYLGVEFTSNIVIIDKEWVKYSINKLDLPRIYTDLVQKQNTNNMSLHTIDAKNATFNFIDTFNCIVDKQSESDNISKFGNNGLKIVYKPIFYKAQDLQLISLRDGFKQKIGINLADFMTKIAVFKLIIGNIEYSEFGRNDIYVIFEVDANMINGTSGIYNIVDNGDVYISSGRWVKN